MSSNPWLSVLIPVYNVEQYVLACVSSVVSQCDQRVEVLLLNDKSTDSSMEVLSRMDFGERCDIRLLSHSENKGLSAARNSLLREAKGEYVWFLDSDDALSEGAISQLKSIVDLHSPDVVLCDYSVWRPGVTVSPKRAARESRVSSFGGVSGCLSDDPSALFEGLFRRGRLHAWSKIFKRSLWGKDNLFPEGRYFEDMVSTPKLMLQANSYYYCPDVWVKYRQREGSILSTPSEKKIRDMVEALSGVLPLWLSHCPELSYSARYQYYCYCLRVWGYAVKDVRRISGGCSSLRRDMLQLFYSAVGMGRADFCKVFLFRGDLLRTYRFIRWSRISV